MAKTVSATEARIHFGELMRRVVNDQQPVVVEHRGEPQVVILSVGHYRRLQQAEAEQTGWLDRVEQAREAIAKDLNGRKLPPSEEVIQAIREERDAQLLDLR